MVENKLKKVDKNLANIICGDMVYEDTLKVKLFDGKYFKAYIYMDEDISKHKRDKKLGKPINSVINNQEENNIIVKKVNSLKFNSDKLIKKNISLNETQINTNRNFLHNKNHEGDIYDKTRFHKKSKSLFTSFNESINFPHENYNNFEKRSSLNSNVCGKYSDNSLIAYPSGTLIQRHSFTSNLNNSYLCNKQSINNSSQTNNKIENNNNNSFLHNYGKNNKIRHGNDTFKKLNSSIAYKNNFSKSEIFPILNNNNKCFPIMNDNKNEQALEKNSENNISKTEKLNNIFVDIINRKKSVTNISILKNLNSNYGVNYTKKRSRKKVESFNKMDFYYEKKFNG